MSFHIDILLHWILLNHKLSLDQKEHQICCKWPTHKQQAILESLAPNCWKWKNILISVMRVGSDGWHVRRPHFSKGLTKSAIFPDYERPGLICLALPPRQKFCLILVIKWLKNWCYQKESITKNVLLNWYSSMKKKLRKIRMIFDVENWLWKSEIVIFRSHDLERRLISQKICFMKKCYFSLN